MRLVVPLAVFCLVGAALAQSVLVVGPGGYPEISAALTVAQPGDLLQVAPGTYAPFAANVGVRIVAAAGASVVGNGPQFSWFVTTLSAPPGQTLHCRGLTFASSSSVVPHDVRAIAGQVVFEECSFQGGHPAKVLQGLDCSGAHVVLRRCTFDCYHPCLRLQGGSVVASESRFFANLHPIPVGPTPCAVDVVQGDASFAFCELRGATGSSMPANFSGGPAAIVRGNGALSLADCQLTSGDSPVGAPVPAVDNQLLGSVEHARTALVGGFGYLFIGFGTMYMRGPGVAGPAVAGHRPGAIDLPTGVPDGGLYGLFVNSEPNRLVVVPLTFALEPPSAVPLVQDPVRFDAGTLVVPWIGVTDSLGGWMSGPIAIPSGFVSAPIWFHPLVLDGASLRAAVPVGGLVR